MNPSESLAIVTSVYNYGAYLADWAASIITLERRPARVCLFQHGSTDESPAQVDQAAALLREGGLEVRVEHEAERLNLGAARNRAVRMAEGLEWVQHLDADDMLMPHALGDFAALADRCDVVAFGYIRTGDLKAGPKNRQKLYKSSTGLGIHSNPTPASGVSPFRVAFWERSPYAETMPGGWDTALWIGFGHIGARILPTRRPCFWYRQHADSVFNTRRVAPWPTALVGNELQSRRRKDAGVSVLVPRALEDGPDRVRAWDWIRERYAKLRPAWQVVEGKVPAHPWRKGDAIRQALETCRGKVAIVADADCLVDLEVLDQAVDLVASHRAPWVVPHRLVYRLDRAATGHLLTGDPTSDLAKPPVGSLARPAYVGFAGGGVLVVSRPMLQATGGVPHQFAGWGAEDEALGVILDTLLGRHTRLGADLLHCWHPPQSPDKATTSRPNRVEFARIRALADHPDALWSYLVDPATYPRRAGPTLSPQEGAAWRRQAWQLRAGQQREEIAAALDPQAAAARTRGRVGDIFGGDGMGEKALGASPENKMLGVHYATKHRPLHYATAAVAHMAERAGLTEAELRPRLAPGAPVTLEDVRAVLYARRQQVRAR